MFGLLMDTYPSAYSSAANSISILAILISVVVTSGALAWFFRSGMDVRLARRDVDQVKEEIQNLKDSLAFMSENVSDIFNKTTAMESRMALFENVVQDIRVRLGKLDKVDEMYTTMAFIREAVSKLVPEDVYKLQWRSAEQRFNKLEEDIAEVKQVLASQTP